MDSTSPYEGEIEPIEVTNCKNLIMRTLASKFENSLEEFNIKKIEINKNSEISKNLENDIIIKSQNCIKLAKQNLEFFQFLNENSENYQKEFQSNNSALIELTENQIKLNKIYREARQQPEPLRLMQPQDNQIQIEQEFDDSEDEDKKSQENILEEQTIQIQIPKVQEEEEFVEQQNQFNLADLKI